MKLYKDKNQLLIVLLAVGFFMGILYENIFSKYGGITVELFQSYFLQQYKETKIVVEEYFWYVAKARIFPLLLIFILGFTRWKKILVGAVLLWTGFLTGVMTVSAVIQQGMKGILICIVSTFPQIFFYGMTYGIILLHLYYHPRRQWNSSKTIFVTLLMFLGLVLESYLNPLLIKFII